MKLTPDAIKLLRVKRELVLRNARRDPAAFAEYVLRDEVSGKRVKNAAHHKEWHHLWADHQFAVMIAPVSHGKTQCTVARILFILGHNPNRRIAIVSDTERQASKILRQIRGYIQDSNDLHEVFPNLKPSTREGDPWTNLSIVVDRENISKDPSVQALGMGGPLNGSRVDDMVLDDVVSFESSRTPGQREKSLEWFDTTCITRLTQDSTISAIGTPWHPDDLLHTLEKRKGFYSKRFSSVLNPRDPESEWVALWPEKWDTKLLLQRKDNMSVAAFSKKYLCQVVSKDTERFREEWLQMALKSGNGRYVEDRAPPGPDGRIMECYTGVDIGIGQKDASAVTCLFTIGLGSDGKRYVLRVEAGHWTAHEIIQKLQWTYERFSSVIFVEDNGAQRFLVQMCEGRVPVSSWTTTAGRKYHEQFGVESLAAEMARGWWVIPNQDGAIDMQIKEWMDECRHYNPENHTGDRLMAAWICREAARSHSGQKTMFLDLQAR